MQPFKAAVGDSDRVSCSGCSRRHLTRRWRTVGAWGGLVGRQLSKRSSQKT